MSDPAVLVERAVGGERHALARLVSLFEDGRPAARSQQAEAAAALAALGRPPAHIVGVTGTPGSGKSSLLARLTETILEQDDDVRVAVVAVDPSSPTSGGALLGDRIRMRPAETERLFVRSQASAAALGGLAPTTYTVCAALGHLFDVVFVETVGIGQSEADIRQLAHDVVLVVGPLSGDEVQFLKAGIIEIPDAFVVSKWDEPAAQRTFHQLRSSLGLARPADGHEIEIFCTSATTGEGVDELARHVLARRARHDGDHAVAAAHHFFRRWVVDEWGRVGSRHLERLGGAAALVGSEEALATAQDEFERSIRSALADPGR